MTASAFSVELTAGIAVIVAIGGWVFTQWNGTRSLQKNMRVQYLLEAYRRLDGASNRDLNSQRGADIESAFSDIQLLGDPRQVELAHEFAESFAANHQASTDELLEELRLALRQELHLGRVPRRRISLRITDKGPLASTTGNIRHAVAEAVVANLRGDAQAGFPAAPSIHAFVSEMQQLAAESPSAAVVAANARIGNLLVERLGDDLDVNVSELNVPQLAEIAAKRGFIKPDLSQTISGLGILYLLAAMKQDELTLKEATEFVTLSAGVLFELQDSSSHGA